MTEKLENKLLRSLFHDVLNPKEKLFDAKDVTLMSNDNKQIKAHKLVISSASKVLKNVLESDDEKHSTIVFAEESGDILACLYEFMYSGEIRVGLKNKLNFLETAKYLQLGLNEDLISDDNKFYEEDDLAVLDDDTALDSKEVIKEEYYESDFIEYECDDSLPELDDESCLAITLEDTVKQEEVKRAKVEESEELKVSSRRHTRTPRSKKGKRQKIKERIDKIRTNTHRKRERTVKKTEFKCLECAFTAKKKNEVTRHKQRKHEGLEFKCDECSYKSGYSNELKIHVEAKHLGKKYSCDQCDYITSLNKSLKRHIEYKHGDAYLTCKQCPYEAKYKDTLRAHIESVHEEVVYDCQECEYKSKTKKALMHHKRVHHAGLRYSCDQCDFKTKAPSYVKIHMQSHSDKVFKCEECSFETKFKHNVKLHVKNRHTNEPKIMSKCSLCGYTSKTEYQLSRHMERNHDNTPHPCSICPFNATKAWILKEHNKLKHNIQ